MYAWLPSRRSRTSTRSQRATPSYPSLLPCQALELGGGESPELLLTIPGKKPLLVRHDFRSNGIASHTLNKQEVQRRRIAFAGQLRPFLQRVQRVIHVILPVARVVARSEPPEARQRIETKNHLRRLDVESVDVEVASAVNFESVKL